MTATVSNLLHIARGQIGYEEHPRGSNESKFGAWYGINPAPWCAMFASWCFFSVGAPLHISTVKGFSYCPSGESWAKQHGYWTADGKYNAGDLVLFDWGSNGVADHVGIVVDDDGSTIHTIEGNTGNLSQANGGAVMLRTRQHGSHVLGAIATHRLLTGKPSPPARIAPSWPGRTLALTSPLMHGGDVSTWQAQMRARGWKTINVDGIYGQVSSQVCRAFQAEKHLTVDGAVGPATWNATWTTAT